MISPTQQTTRCAIAATAHGKENGSSTGGSIGILSASSISTTIWLFNIAMENGPFLDDFPS